ncbi:MAG: solute carrier family 23 protein [Acholeplasmatales bacterium]|jgi:uracil permease|nr:NCS2 family nucleobase:cation symporter [Acholeplasmataceae bacterium]MDY0114895.1 solute carrier family 23 protein [Acholeplasmatales bacterium]MCK9234223.1 NCS2 family nucleobase:cation symporter [Acholeplasmataceae bacterium]MCK9289260.1 NCS2 family nucleobase:cation symporter [Acholeplasmataceae bacterium]MCK9427164.1 NCS2 family nucleobase:cation symporter [Acholeplasmataceae bacterium]
MKEQLILDTHEKPNFYQWLLLSLQHVFAMFGATILVPMTTGLDVGVALIGSGIGTLIYIVLTKAKVPMYLGSSFAYIAAITSAYQATGSFDSALIGIAAVGLIYVIVAILIHYFGTKWLKWLLPGVVVGPMIMVIGLSLAPVAVGQITELANEEIIGWQGYLVAAVTFLTIVIVSIKGKGFMKIIPFIFGILSGYLVSLMVGIVDYSLFKDISFFHLPKFQIIGTYKLNFSALYIFIPLAFVTIMEHIGDHEVLGAIMDRDFLVEPGLKRTLMGDGIATLAAGLIGAPANTSYGENTGVVALTKVGSVWVTGGAAVFAILLAFIKPINVFITSIPTPVLGGMSLVLFGMIAANGLKVIYKDKVDLNDTKNIIIIATMLVVGLGGLVISFSTEIKLETMALAAIIGIMINLLFKLLDFITISKKNKV